VNALPDPLDQVELPAPAFHLPDPERDEARRQQHTEQGEEDPARRPPIGAAASGNIVRSLPRRHGCHGNWLASCSGIMFAFRWYITHSEPESAMTTMTIVKSSAIIVQPPSELAFMCRK